MVPHEPLEQLGRVGLDDELGVLGAEVAGHDPGVATLVEHRVLEADRERADRAAAGAGHRAHHDGRVDAAGEEGAERHVGHEPARHRRLDVLTDDPGGVGGAEGELVHARDTGQRW